ncbi:hypothetical protein ACS0TY_020809 [Phlomoides rotata]
MISAEVMSVDVKGQLMTNGQLVSRTAEARSTDWFKGQLSGGTTITEDEGRYAQYILWQALERPLLKSGSPSVTQKERVQQAEPQQVFQVPEPGKVDSTYTSPSKEKVHQGVKSCWFFNNTWENLLKGVEFDATNFITDVFEKYPRLWALKGAHPIIVNMWHNNPHLKRGEELEIKFITAASEDRTNSIQYPSFHFMKL